MSSSNKRRNNSSSGNLAKGARMDDGGRRGLSHAAAGGVPVLPPSLPLASSTPARQKSISASRGRAARQRELLNGMARLNYQLYQWAQRQLNSEESIPDDAFYDGIVENYILRANDLHRRFNLQYGDVVVFGDGDCGQLGCGSAVTEARKPKILANLRGAEITMVASGGLHSLALSSNGTVYSWGCPDEGSLGWLATEEKDDGALPSQVVGFYPSQYGPGGKAEDKIPFEQRKEAIITQIAAGETQSLALSTEGEVFTWGAFKDDEGRKFRNIPPKDDTRVTTGNKDMSKLEEDDNPEFYRPPRGNQDWPMHLVEIPRKAKDVSAGGAFNCALLDDDSMVTWGMGTCGELGRSVPDLNKKTSNEVVLEQFLKPKPPIWEQPTLKRAVVTMSCGGMHLLAVSREQGGLCVYSTGLNQYGQLGHGDQKNRDVLEKVKFFEGQDVTMVEGGYQFSCFVDKTGRNLYTCGRGDYGSLGITLEQPDPGYFESLPCRAPLVYQPDENVSEPKENSINEENIVEDEQPEIEQISCGSTHVLVKTKGGSAYSWGFGTSGACGQGKSDDDVLRPKMLEMKKCKVRYVSGGGQHSTVIVTTASQGAAS